LVYDEYDGVVGRGVKAVNILGWMEKHNDDNDAWIGWRQSVYIRGSCTDFNIQHSSPTVRQLSKSIGFSSFWLPPDALEVGRPERVRGLHLLPPGLDSFVCFGLPQVPFYTVGYLLLSYGTPLEPPLI
jgi:hypothetical protein